MLSLAGHGTSVVVSLSSDFSWGRPEDPYVWACSEVKHGGAEVAGSFDPGAPEARLRLRVKVLCVAL